METARPIPDLRKGELAGEVRIDVSLIPDAVRDNLAAATLDSVRAFLRQPGGREKLDARIAAKKAAPAAK